MSFPYSINSTLVLVNMELYRFIGVVRKLWFTYSAYMYVYVYIYTFIYAYMYIHEYIRTYVHMYTYVCIHLYITMNK